MTKKKSSLGRGLASILGTSSSDITSKPTADIKTENPVVVTTHEILISQIVTNPFQPRTEFDQEKLNELAVSIEQLGIIQPITVREMGYDKFQLISGERRFRASQIAGLNKIPAFVRIANDQEMLEMALVENIQRENLNPIEVALSYQRLIDEIKLTQEQCSERVGKNRSTVTNFLRLLKLPEVIQKGLSEGRISNGHAKALLAIKDENSQINLFYDTVANGYSVREVEQLAKEFSNSTYTRTSKSKVVSTPNPLAFSQQKMVHDLSINLEKDVELKRNNKGKGKLIIPFANDEDLQRIFIILNN
jgi:ParB family chromosome partitioning protein